MPGPAEKEREDGQTDDERVRQERRRLTAAALRPPHLAERARTPQRDAAAALQHAVAAQARAVAAQARAMAARDRAIQDRATGALDRPNAATRRGDGHAWKREDPRV